MELQWSCKELQRSCTFFAKKIAKLFETPLQLCATLCNSSATLCNSIATPCHSCCNSSWSYQLVEGWVKVTLASLVLIPFYLLSLVDYFWIYLFLELFSYNFPLKANFAWPHFKCNFYTTFLKGYFLTIQTTKKNC